MKGHNRYGFVPVARRCGSCICDGTTGICIVMIYCVRMTDWEIMALQSNVQVRYIVQKG